MKTWVFAFVILLALIGVSSAETQIVAGAGPSTEIAELFFGEFNKHPEVAGTTFGVMPGSVKHSGGIKNSDIQLFGRTGRPLSAEERALGKSEIFLGRVPIGFAGGMEIGVKKLTDDQLKLIYTRKITNWKQVGGADTQIYLAGREPTEAVFSELKEQLPWFSDVKFDQTFKSDNDVDKFIESPAGRHAIIFGASTQFRDIQLIKIAGLSLGIRVGLVYDNKNKDNPLVGAARKYSESDHWRGILEKNGYFTAR